MKPEKVCSSNDRIREILNHFQINQTEFCKRTGVQKSALSNYLNGNRLPRQDQLFKIAEAFNISAAWLMGYDVPMQYDQDFSVIALHNGEDNKKPHIEYFGKEDRLKLYKLLLEVAESCTPDQVLVIIETLKTFAKSNQRRNDNELR